jgi:CheY-like chemotaxis protein
LERGGYTVLTSTNGEEAIEVYRAHQDEIALVLTDTVMPKMGGEELYEALRQINPAVKALLMSGYSLRQDVADLRAKGLKGFVQKPLDFYKLGLAVRKVLDE